MSKSSQPLKILFIASEVEGLIKTGGLADVAYALPKTLISLGHDVRIVMPAYETTKTHWESWPSTQLHLELSAFYDCEISFRAGQHDSIPTIAIEHPTFKRLGIYDDGQHGYDDNILRFSILSKAALHYAKSEQWQPDIVHGNDWQSAMAMFYLAEHFKGDDFFKDTRSVLTLHNAAYQGHAQAHWHQTVGIHERFYQQEDFEDHGQINLLKGALSFADTVSTVSPGYAAELITPEGGHGLHFKFSALPQLTGILNGCDYSQWDPEQDSHLNHHYATPTDPGKSANKANLQKELGLEESSETPLLVAICRLTDQKGIHLLIPMLWNLLQFSKCQVAILGSGDKKLADELDRLQHRYPDQVRFINGYNVGLSHRMEAGGDAFLMPSIFEPCGLNQIYSLRYGTLPLVRSTGGLKDSVTPLSAAQRNVKSATGFCFEEPTEQALLKETMRLLNVYHEKPMLWQQMQTNAMAQRFLWSKSVKHYIKMYCDTLAKPKRSHPLI
ncbi:glycogen synthase [Reinekea marina]|uniref:Glycogen synthase n=1 Tax=Reinekea marina TaxID=1310421 RepID=A0ABV7WRV0_9GAMM|nr:glycogen synthase [Reinekea marina]MDN3649268.1 glycogen synthase [Reinekea marina]